jgi:hypothetical protein
MVAASRRLGAGLVCVSSLLVLNGCQGPEASDWTRFRAPPTELEFAVSFPESVSMEPQDGRVILVVSKAEEGEPRFQVEAGPDGQQVFGLDVMGLAPGEAAIVGDTVFGFPLEGLGLIPAGEYTVQAVLNRYETYTRSDGHTVSLPPDRGEGQQWNRKPGNLYSVPTRIRVDPGAGGQIQVVMDQVIPEIAPPQDTDWVKHVRMRSELLSDFWGTDVYLGAHVLLPAGFDEHPEARYPIAIFHGHFPSDFGGWRTVPPDEEIECEYSARFDWECYNRTQQELAYQLYRDWTRPGFPRMLVVEIQHPTPYYDDSYAVNSENNGPYGDALTYELIPYIEEQFRGIGEGWARFTYGGSTGGWEALAVQIFYPDEYNGTYGACPDPIDFRAYELVNIYDDENAYKIERAWGTTYRPAHRDWLGHVTSTVQQDNHLESVLASRGRSGGQWDIWQAVYSPVGEDGYPAPIWDKMSGEIDPGVAEYWRENYDLRYILERDWAELGPRLDGKLHIYVGDMDNYYLNNAVYLTEEFLESTTDPYYGGEIDYGDRFEHCWNGDHDVPNAISRLRYVQMFGLKWAEEVRGRAPMGADLTSWRY